MQMVAAMNIFQLTHHLTRIIAPPGQVRDGVMWFAGPVNREHGVARKTAAQRGACVGAPDVIVVSDGVAHGLFVGAEVSGEWREAGVRCAVVRNVGEVEGALRHWSIPYMKLKD